MPNGSSPDPFSTITGGQMPATLLLQCAIPSAAGIPADTVVNHWHFQVEATPPSSSTLQAIRDAVQTFYQSFTIGYCTSQTIASACTYKFYNLADPLPRRPIATYSTGLGTLQTVQGLPAEVSCVLSFQGQPVSGVPQAQRRNRIYLPPVGVGTLTGTSGRTWSTTFTTAVKNGAAALLTASDAASDWTWMVRSSKTSATTPVVSGWVDDAFDIQRRRGYKATSRVTFP